MMTISQAAEFQSLQYFRDFIAEMCKDYPQVDEETLYDLKLATDEACTNIITHGYAGMNPGMITLGCEVGRESIRLEVIDYGRPFRMNGPMKPDIEASLENGVAGGFGLYLVYKMMDDVIYETNEDRNCLRLIKKMRSE
jgi:anti-sigma regulatory factor (Ser/Thr protein kinase)